MLVEHHEIKQLEDEDNLESRDFKHIYTLYCILKNINLQETHTRFALLSDKFRIKH